jgi:hypothetical protein
VSFLDGSLALAGLALTALLASSASVVLVWRFRTERHDPVAAERLERRAQAWVALTMIVVALYVAVQSIRALIDGSHPEASRSAILRRIARGAACCTTQLRVALRLSVERSVVMVCSYPGVALAAVALAALTVNSVFAVVGQILLLPCSSPRHWRSSMHRRRHRFG